MLNQHCSNFINNLKAVSESLELFIQDYDKNNITAETIANVLMRLRTGPVAQHKLSDFVEKVLLERNLQWSTQF